MNLEGAGKVEGRGMAREKVEYWVKRVFKAPAQGYKGRWPLNCWYVSH